MPFDYIVSVRLMTYNHEKFIKEAMDNIMMQETTFPVEVVVGDDFSTDKTLEIIRSYSDTENIHVRILDRPRGGEYDIKRQEKGRLYNFQNIIESCTGKYIALLDGDDYWTDPLKLQKQVDFLEENESFSLCFHDVDRVDERNVILQKSISVANKFNQEIFSQKEMLTFEFFVNTLSVVFRNNLTLPSWFVDLRMGDKPLLRILGVYGKAYYFKESMGAYRMNFNGVSQSQHNLVNGSLLDVLKENKIIYENILNEFKVPDELSMVLKRVIEQLQFSLQFYKSDMNFFSRFFLLLRSRKHLRLLNRNTVKSIGLLLFVKGLQRRAFLYLINKFEKESILS